MNKIVRGLCVAIGVALLGGSYYLYNNFVNPPKIVHVTDNNYHREYSDDGSGSVALVMLQGKITSGETTFDNLEVPLKYPIMQRKVEMYQFFLDGEKPMMGWQDVPVKSFKDKQGREFKNPAFPKDFKNQIIYNDFTVNNGKMPVSQSFLKKYLDLKKYQNDFLYLNLPENKTPEGYQYNKNYYLKPAPGKSKIGSIRVYYKVLNPSKLPEVTLIGQQTKGAVKWHSLDSRFYEGKKELAEIQKTYDLDAPHAALGVACFGAFFVLLGLFKADV